jgi:protein-disulfide isomerase
MMTENARASFRFFDDFQSVGENEATMNISRRMVVVPVLAAVGGAALLPMVGNLSTAAAIDQPIPPHGEMELGAPDAKVTIIEFASASCPHCRAWHVDIFKRLKPDYIDTKKVRFIFREFPHNDAGLAGFMLARCVPMEKYFPLVDVLFEQQESWTADPLPQLRDIAAQAGLSVEDFDACMKNETLARNILSVRDAASVAGVSGVPSLFINGERFEDSHNWDALKARMDSLL